jgi:sugar phosphate isomerase/epimerase
MRFAICNEQFEGWDFGRVCRYLRDVGYEGVEIAPFTLAPIITDLAPGERERLKHEADEAGIAVVGLHWLLAKTEGLHLTSPDDDVRMRTGDYLVSLAHACRDLGGDVMVLGSPQQRSRLPGVSADRAYELAADTLGAALPAMADIGITLCLEPLSPAETDFVNTCDDALRLIALVGEPNMVLHLDVKAMSSEPDPPADLIRLHGPTAGHFHANDANRRGPGFGDVDFVPIFAALDAAGYHRWVSVEVFDYRPDPETIAEQSLAYMRSCLERARQTQAGDAGR